MGADACLDSEIYMVSFTKEIRNGRGSAFNKTQFLYISLPLEAE